jgi:predicted amidophosphoribosyltransferase
MLSMQLSGVKKLSDRFGFSWIFGSEEEIKKIDLKEIEPVPLSGNFDAGFALGEYSISESEKRKRTIVGDLLHKFKYEQDHHAGELLAELASDFIESRIPLKSTDLMLAVPPSFRSRLFDHVSFLAQRIQEKTKIQWEKDVFVRTRLTKPQKDIRGNEARQLNVLNTYKLARPLKLDGKKVLLVDEVIASGATLDEISFILWQENAEKIFVLILAKSICPRLDDSSSQ